MKISSNQRKALEAVFDTYIPSIEKEGEHTDFWRRKASDLNIVDDVLDLVDRLEPEHQAEIKQLLQLISSPALGLTWMGDLKPFHKLTESKRVKLLQAWSQSKLPQLRKGFVTLRKLSMFIFYGKVENGVNPNWAAIGYPGPLKGKVKARKALNNIIIKKGEDLVCDTVIVGSGAGGSVIAAELTKKGEQVIVVEKGPYIKPEEMTEEELTMIDKTYDRHGALATEDGHMAVYAGSCVGGGTTINWAGSFRTPDYVLEEWAKDHHNPHFTDKAYDECFEFIEKRTQVNSDYLNHNPQNQLLKDGCEKRGIATKIIPRNISHSDDPAFYNQQGYMGLGDPYSNKQSALVTFLEDASNGGAKILADTEVENVIVKNGTATGVIATQKTATGSESFMIKAKRVVVAAGAIHTPALLMRSGLSHPYLGKNLCLHPVMVALGIYEQKVEPWYGPMMSVVSDAFTQIDGNYGFKIETPPAHVGMMSTALPWQNGAQSKELMLQAPYLGMFLILCREKFGGEVKVGKRKRPMVHYKLNNYDLKHLLKGVEEATKLHEAAGAEKMAIIHSKMELYEKEKGTLDAYIKRNLAKPWQTNKYPLFSAHQMATCAMGGTDNRHPIKPDGTFRGVKNLFVADGSAFPHASGANPMLSIQALAYYISKGM